MEDTRKNMFSGKHFFFLLKDEFKNVLGGKITEKHSKQFVSVLEKYLYNLGCLF